MLILGVEPLRQELISLIDQNDNTDDCFYTDPELNSLSFAFEKTSFMHNSS